MTTTEDIQTMSDSELASLINLIEENIAECGQRSSYTSRNRPVLKAARAEVKRRAK